MKQQVKRLTLTGNWTAFTFSKKSYSFFVKNFTENDIFVSFENNDQESESFKIKSGVGEEVFINENARRDEYLTDTIYVKGTGEVEVQQLKFKF